MIIEKSDRKLSNELYQKIRKIQNGFMARCYNPNNNNYKNYGGNGVTVCKKWHTVDGFLDDVDKIENFSIEGILNGDIQLDKDIKQKNNDSKIYSLETTIFVSGKVNSSNRRSNKDMILIAPNGDRFYSNNREELAREHNLNSRHLFNVLNKKSKHYKGYQIFYLDTFKEEDVRETQMIWAIDPSECRYIFNNIAKFAKEYGLSSANISMVISGKNTHHKGWTFRKLRDGIIIQ